MKRELALQLLRKILPEDTWDEDRFQRIFAELGILADLKYNRYEMFQPGRLFFENLYAWLLEFKENDRSDALEFIHNNLVFVSREEFEQLTQVIYHDRIRQSQFDLVSEITGIDRHRVKQLDEHDEMKRIQRASLYVAMSDGARIDYFRRQNLDINNEQVLPSYDASEAKLKSVLRDLEKEHGKGSKFECLYLIDDFSASGRTLLREIVIEILPSSVELEIPRHLKGRIKFDVEDLKLQLSYEDGKEESLTKIERKEFLALSDSAVYRTALLSLFKKYDNRETEMVGSLVRLSSHGLFKCLIEMGRVYFCPLLITEYALNRLKSLIPRAENEQLRNLQILPAGIIEDSIRLGPNDVVDKPIARLCEDYYSDKLEDEHTGNVKFGYDGCGLPVVLHHNTPNNSIYLLWARKWENPLFARYERHGRDPK